MASTDGFPSLELDAHGTPDNSQEHVAGPEQNATENTMTVGDAIDHAPNGDNLDPCAPLQEALAQRPIPTFKLRTVGAIQELMENPEYMDLNPEYQRGDIWSRKRQSELIESIFLLDTIIVNIAIPPLIFSTQEIETSSGLKYKRTVVDGKQRMTAIKNFVNGDIPMKYGGKSYYYCHRTGGKRLGSLLSDMLKLHFRRYPIMCYEYSNLQRDQEEDAFSRVQRGVKLTTAEELKATSGPWQTLAARYEQDFDLVVRLSQNDRGKGFLNILSCFRNIIECKNATDENRSPALQIKLSELLQFTKTPLSEALKSQLRHVFNAFDQLARSRPLIFQSYRLWTSARNFAPIEMIAVSCLISLLPDTPFDEIEENIRNLRQYLREEHEDIRSNSVVWKSVWKFINRLLQEESSLREQGGVPRRQAVQTESPWPSMDFNDITEEGDNHQKAAEGEGEIADHKNTPNITEDGQDQLSTTDTEHILSGPAHPSNHTSNAGSPLIKKEPGTEDGFTGIDADHGPKINVYKSHPAFSTMSPVNGSHGHLGTQTSGLSRKRRAALDLGTSSTRARELAAKRAKQHETPQQE